MLTRRVAALAIATLLALHVLYAPGISADAKPERYAVSTDNSGLIGAPFQYQDAMLVVATEAGVAAIVFDVKDEKLVNLSANYRYRFLKDAAAQEETGTGRLHDSSFDREELTIKAGPIRVGWSSGGKNRGWVYYQREEMRISIVDAKRFDKHEVELPGAKQRLEKLDLKRFLKTGK